jgi:hypothetical protein
MHASIGSITEKRIVTIAVIVVAAALAVRVALFILLATLCCP